MSTCVIEPDATGASDAKANYPVALAIDATDAIESSRPANIRQHTSQHISESGGKNFESGVFLGLFQVPSNHMGTVHVENS